MDNATVIHHNLCIQEWGRQEVQAWDCDKYIGRVVIIDRQY